MAKTIKPLTQGTQFQLPSQSTEENLEKIEEFSTSFTNTEEYTFISENIPPEDKFLWLSALMLKEAGRKGDRERVQLIKEQMISQHGQKGRNIANICSAGYLKEYIIPWYKHYVEENHDKDSFLENYHNIVDLLLFVVFVSGFKSVEDLMMEIENKIQSLRSANIDHLFIHAIGESNKQKAEKVVERLQEEQSFIKEIKKITTRVTLKAEIIL